MTRHQNPINVFLSYAHEDEPLLRNLETHLSALKRQGLISTWYDRQIVPGSNWAKEIDQRLEQASIILLLVSADFLASDYCYQVEMKRAMARHEAGEARVVPIEVRPCDWSHTPFATLQSLPRDGKAITTWDNRDLAWKEVTVGIRQTIEYLHLRNVPALPRQEMESRSTPELTADRSSVDVCIVSALAEEARAFLEVVRQQCKGTIEEHISPRYHFSYRFAAIKNNHDEPLNLHVSWLPRYGPQEMALHLTHILEECQPRIIIMTGICAGDAQHVQLGDLIVAERTFTYDNGKFTRDEYGRSVHEHDTMTYQLDANISQFLGLFDDWRPLVARLKRPSSPSEERKRRKVACHIKPMASGSAVRADNPFEGVRASVRGTVAIDMEGAAFGLVMSRHPLIPWLVVKGVCDYADRDKNDVYHDYAARASALYALSFIRAYVTNERLHRLNGSTSPSGSFPIGSNPHSISNRPSSYIPFPLNPLFQPRPHEFERLESLLFRSDAQQQPARIGLIGMVGMGGVGKTQLAVQLAYRHGQRFPSGIFWMPATGMSLFEWQHQLADLAAKIEYLPPGDDPSSPENELRRARHLGHYLADHADALLILDNVEKPELITFFFSTLVGRPAKCTILYTSRHHFTPPGVMIHIVEQLPEEAALRLLLETTRPSLLVEILAASQSIEAKAARNICQGVGYLPLALMHLQGALARDRQLTLVKLAEVLEARGALEIAKRHYLDADPLSATFELSWKQVRDEGTRRLFKLASYFPEASPIPLWLLGIVAGLGESGGIFEPLGEACIQLQELSLIEELSEGQVRLHPLIRDFGQRLVIDEGDAGKSLLEEAGERLQAELTDLNKLEARAQQESYWGCLEQIRAAREYAERLGTHHAKLLGRIEHWLDRESYLLANGQWWPDTIPGLFYQQLFNRSIEEEQPIVGGKAPVQWLRQMVSAGVADQALLRAFAGHTGVVESVAFSPDGKWVLTGSYDQTARLWETESGKLVATLEGHTDAVTHVAFSPDGRQILTGSWDKTARLWETGSGKLLTTLGNHTYRVWSVAFSPDGRQVFTGSDDGPAHLWETRSGKLLAELDLDGVSSVAFSPDGRQLLTGEDSIEGSYVTAQLWETRSGKLLTTLEGHTGKVSSVAFSPDGHIALTSDEHGRVLFWRIRRPKKSSLQGIYTAPYEIGAAYWQNNVHVLLVDTGGPHYRPHFYHLKLEGM